MFIHGFNCAPTMYEKFLDLLSLDFAVYTLDLPGVNKSETVDASLYNTNAYIECINEFIPRYLPGKQFAVCGHSMGGYLSTIIASQHENCMGCVAFCPVGLQVKFNQFVDDNATNEQIIFGQERGYLEDIASISNQQIAQRLWCKIE